MKTALKLIIIPALLILVIQLLFPISSLAQGHWQATELAVKLALTQAQSELPPLEQINAAYQEYVAALPHNGSITKAPTRYHTPWDSDPLAANKVILFARFTYTSPPATRDYAIVLIYDFMTQKYKFQAITMMGIKRYDGDKNTSSFLEPGDLTYLYEGWIYG